MLNVKVRPLMDGNLLLIIRELHQQQVKIRPLMDGNLLFLHITICIYSIVKIRPLMDGNDKIWEC